jgi:hypothetical protein
MNAPQTCHCEQVGSARNTPTSRIRTATAPGRGCNATTRSVRGGKVIRRGRDDSTSCSRQRARRSPASKCGAGTQRMISFDRSKRENSERLVRLPLAGRGLRN